LTAAFAKLKPGYALYQFYGPRCPVAREALEQSGLVAERIGGTLANFPPAMVYRFRRVSDQ
jgi:phosphatidylethanolamine/phosphatidyl-N-methylethanolamine N-methyltransferase